MGSLSGGSRDVTPPKVVSSTPKNYSVNFKKEKVEITFDEFIVLDNVNQELVISPPLPDRTDVRLKNKSILIELQNDLIDSTTYTLNFGQSIKDNNEGNILENFEFVFSTGSYLDSLSIYGRLLNSFDNTPPKDPIGIMLYDHIYDSVVYKEKPIYIGKTDKEGYFAINNLRADTFKIFALKDFNSNFLFDLPTEEIAFIDSSIYLTPEFFSRFAGDTLVVDTLSQVQKDSIDKATKSNEKFSGKRSASLNTNRFDAENKTKKSGFRGKSNFDKILVEMSLFTEKNDNQFLSDNNRKSNNLIDFSFNLPVSDSFKFRSLIPDREDWYFMEENATRDTFNLWITDSTVIKSDSVWLELSYISKDSLLNNYLKKDSLIFIYRDPNRQTTSRKNKNIEGKIKENFLNLNLRPGGSTAELNAKMYLESTTPVTSYDSSKLVLSKTVDTLQVAIPVSIMADKKSSRKLKILNTWEPDTKYILTIYPGAVTDIYGITNDTLNLKFTTRKSDYYGVLLVNVSGVKDSVIVQIMDEKEKVIRESTIQKDQLIRYEYMKPANYIIKFIHDSNGNGKWDTGKYIKGLQPERVEYYRDGDASVRSNWEVEIKPVLKTIGSIIDSK
jgi:Bacterial Ig-like domain